jgi:hypothetical protein
MKKFLILLAFAALPFTNLMAQPQERKEALQALFAAFVTRQLNLTPEDAQKFWPIYNQYDAESRKLQNPDPLVLQQMQLDLKKKYKPEFLKAISADQFNKLLTIDKDWKDKLRQELERRKQLRQDRKQGKNL